jgi:hypothetical protein
VRAVDDEDRVGERDLDQYEREQATAVHPLEVDVLLTIPVGELVRRGRAIDVVACAGPDELAVGVALGCGAAVDRPFRRRLVRPTFRRHLLDAELLEPVLHRFE